MVTSFLHSSPPLKTCYIVIFPHSRVASTRFWLRLYKNIDKNPVSVKVNVCKPRVAYTYIYLYS